MIKGLGVASILTELAVLGAMAIVLITVSLKKFKTQTGIKMLRYLIEKEFKQIKRNTFIPRLILMMPLLAMIIFPYAANFDVKNIDLSVIDHDKSSYSQELIQKVQSSGYFRISDVSGTYDEAIKSVEADESDVILEIPLNFERDLVKEQKADLMISANAVNGNKGGLGSAYLTNIIS